MPKSVDDQVYHLLGWSQDKIKRTRTCDKLEAVSKFISQTPVLKESIVNCTPVIPAQKFIEKDKPKEEERKPKENKEISCKQNNLQKVLEIQRKNIKSLRDRLITKESFFTFLDETEDISALSESIAHDVQLLSKFNENEQKILGDIKNKIEMKKRLVGILNHRDEFDQDRKQVEAASFKIEETIKELAKMLD